MRRRIFASIFSLILIISSFFVQNDGYTRAALEETAFSFTTSQPNSFFEIGNYKTNIGCSLETESAVTTYVSTNILDNAETVKYIDFFGMKHSELIGKGVKILYVPTVETFQIVWGTDISWLQLGEVMTFSAGMPVYYQADGVSAKMTLNETTKYAVSSLNLDENIVSIQKLVDYSSFSKGGTWGLKDERRYNTAEQASGYYNNIVLTTCDITENVSVMRFTLDIATMAEYFSYANLSTEECIRAGIKVIAIKDGDSYVIQLQWGNSTNLVTEGDEIIFKKGLPVVGTTESGEELCYYLDKEYRFSIMKYEEGINGYVLVKNREVFSCLPGDMDEDRLLNNNDVLLMKKQLLGIVNVSHFQIADANEDQEICIQDYMHALKNWQIDETENYTVLYEDDRNIVSIPTGESVSYTLNQDIDENNYIRLTYRTTENLCGTFSYTGDDGGSYTEEFYLSADEIQFKQFFDNYRSNGQNVVGKTLSAITLTNVGNSTATILLNTVDISARDVIIDDMLYLENDSLKIGADLNMGGALGYMESLKYQPVEVMDAANKDIRIETDYVATESTIVLDEKVNLINIYDLGRQMQQSYYIDVLDEDYEHGSYNNQESWPYNPVQAGDKYNNHSQIIDYRVIDTKDMQLIYIKTRAMDWSRSNYTTRSYMENYYRLEGNLLYVDNTFVNWEGFEQIGATKSQELPAFYTVQSFNYFVEGNDTSTRTTYGAWTNRETGFAVDGNDTSKWYAWVNADSDTAFGLGIYIPMTAACIAGRSVVKRTYVDGLEALLSGVPVANQKAYNAPILKMGHEYLNNKYTSEYQNCYVVNTSYIAPIYNMKIQEYRSYEYTYVLTADKLDKINMAFKILEQEDAVINDSLLLW